MKPEEKELNQIAYEAQVLQRNGQLMSQQVESLRESVAQFKTGLDSLKAVKNREGKEDLMIPLGGGVMAHAKLTDPDKTIVEVGGGVIIEKSVDDAIKTLEERAEEAGKNMKEIETGLTEITSKLQKMDARAKDLIAKVRAGEQKAVEEEE